MSGSFPEDFREGEPNTSGSCATPRALVRDRRDTVIDQNNGGCRRSDGRPWQAATPHDPLPIRRSPSKRSVCTDMRSLYTWRPEEAAVVVAAAHLHLTGRIQEGKKQRSPVSREKRKETPGCDLQEVRARLLADHLGQRK